MLIGISAVKSEKIIFYGFAVLLIPYSPKVHFYLVIPNKFSPSVIKIDVSLPLYSTSATASLKVKDMMLAIRNVSNTTWSS